MGSTLPSSAILLQRMVNAVEQVRQRLIKATDALREAGVEHALVGGNAVAAWVATVDQAAVRNTQDVDILVQRDDLEEARRALEAVGFVYRRAANLDLFLDGPNASPRQAVHLVFANELIKPGEPAPSPSVSEATEFDTLRVINLDALVRIKLTAYDVFQKRLRARCRAFTRSRGILRHQACHKFRTEPRFSKTTVDLRR